MKKIFSIVIFSLLTTSILLISLKIDNNKLTHKSNTIDYGISIKVSMAEWLWLEIESIIKQRDNSMERIRLLAHGIPTSLGGIRFDELALQIINGRYINKKGIKFNSYFQDRIKSNKDILIELDACNTGAYYNQQIDNQINIKNSYAYNLGLFLKNYIQKQYPNYKGKIIITAPNGYISWLLGLDYIFSPNYAKDNNGNKGKINEFIF